MLHPAVGVEKAEPWTLDLEDRPSQGGRGWATAERAEQGLGWRRPRPLKDLGAHSANHRWVSATSTGGSGLKGESAGHKGAGAQGVYWTSRAPGAWDRAGREDGCCRWNTEQSSRVQEGKRHGETPRREPGSQTRV